MFWRVFNKGLSDIDTRTQVAASLTRTFSKLMPKTESSMLINSQLDSVIEFTECFNDFVEGDSIEVHTHKHKRVKFSKVGGNINIELLGHY